MVTSIIQVIGIKDDLELETETYKTNLRNFRKSILDSIEDKTQYSKIRITHNRDISVVTFEEIKDCIIFHKNLQKKLISKSLVFRAILCSGNISLSIKEADAKFKEKYEGLEVKSFEFNDPRGNELITKLEKFKGIGVNIQNDIVEGFNAEIREHTFVNFFVPHSDAKHYERFLDMRVSNSLKEGDKLENLLELFRGSNFIKPKYARFFIPIIINICKNTNLEDWPRKPEMVPKKVRGKIVTDEKGKPILEKKDIVEYGKEIDILISKIKPKSNVQGFELIPFSLANKIFDQKETQKKDVENNSREEELKEFLKRWKWLTNRLENQNFMLSVPEEILSKKARYSFGKFISSI